MTKTTKRAGQAQSQPRRRGRLTQWHDAKGYGFITPLSGKERIFLHATALQNRERRPVVGELLSFAVEAGSDGRPQAVAATFAGERLKVDRRERGGISHIWLAVGALGALTLSAIGGFSPALLAAAYWVMSLLTWAFYLHDKRAAQANRWRVPEAHLHLLALLGGWPGALLARSLHRHKTKKQPFTAIFWLTVALNCALLWWLWPWLMPLLGQLQWP